MTRLIESLPLRLALPAATLVAILLALGLAEALLALLPGPLPDAATLRVGAAAAGALLAALVLGGAAGRAVREAGATLRDLAGLAEAGGSRGDLAGLEAAVADSAPVFESRDSLRRERDIFRAAADAGSMGLMTGDPEFNIRWVSAAATALLA
jgi:hypothetical protein